MHVGQSRAEVCGGGAVALPFDIFLTRVPAGLGAMDPLLVDAAELLLVDSADRNSNGTLLVLLLFGQTFKEDAGSPHSLLVDSSWPHTAPVLVFNRFVLRIAMPDSLLSADNDDVLRLTVHLRDYFNPGWLARAGVNSHHRFAAVLKEGALVRSSPVFCCMAPAPRRPQASLSAKPQPAYFLTVCAVVRNEPGDRLAEWVRWHMHEQGVDRMVVYDDHSSDGGAAVAALNRDDGSVIGVSWPGRSYWRQLTALNHCHARHGPSTLWISALDVDEFLQAPQAGSVRQALLNSQAGSTGRDAPPAAFWLPWLQFGPPTNNSGSASPPGSNGYEDRPHRRTHSSGLCDGPAPAYPRLCRHQWRAAQPLVGSGPLFPGGPPMVAGKSIWQPRVASGLEITHVPVLRPDSGATLVQTAATVLSVRHLALQAPPSSANTWGDQLDFKKASYDTQSEFYSTTFDLL